MQIAQTQGHIVQDVIAGSLRKDAIPEVCMVETTVMHIN